MASLQHMRSGNRIRLLQTLRHVGGADRAELARMTGLSRATVSGLVGEAIARGHVVESRCERPTPTGRRRRAPAVLRLDPRGGMVVGVDLGHSHVRVVLADLEATVVGERRIACDVDASPDVALDATVALVDELVGSLGIEPRRLIGVGLGVPRPVVRGPGTPAGGPIPLAWAGAPPAEELSRRLGLPVRIENDANLGVLGEHAHGAARGAKDVVYVKLSTGVGAGLLLDGSLYVGARGIAGDIGHVTVAPTGPICRCGNRGCLETLASTGALARALAPTHGDRPTLRRLLKLVDDGDAVVSRALRDIGRHVGRALAPVCLALDVELVVLGGELGAASPHVLGGVRAELRTMWGARRIAVRPALLGDRAGALGPVALVLGEEAWLHRAGLIALEAGGGIAGRHRPAGAPLAAAG